MPPPLLLDLSDIDVDRVLVDAEGIRKINPHRYEIEQLSAIVHLDNEKHEAVAFKDVTPQEFWVRGHMPDFPLMPGVLMCEAAAQLASYYSMRFDLLGGDLIAFGGIEHVRFREQVRPGDRLLITAKLKDSRRNRRAIFAFQEFVGETMVCHGELIGVPIYREAGKRA